MKRAAVDGIGKNQTQPIRVGAGNRAVSHGYVGLHGARQMHQVHAAAGNFRRLRARRDRRHGSFPRTESFLYFIEGFVAIEVADHQQQRLRRDVIGAVELRERVARVRLHLFFGGGDGAVGMSAE